MPREPRSDGPLVEAEVKTDPSVGLVCPDCGAAVRRGDLFCGKCGASLEASERGAGSVQARGGQVKMKQQVKGKTAGFARGISKASIPADRKNAPKGGTLMPLLLILALVWIGGMGYLAYKFFISKDDTTNGGVTVEYPNGGAVVTPDPNEFQEQLPAIQPPDDPDESAPEFTWSDADARGYSKPVSRSSSNKEPVLDGTVLGDRVRLRSEPNTDSRVIRHFNKGVKVEITRRYTTALEEYPWYNIKANGRSGWMYGQYVGEITQRVE
jgi:hypothetical protein